MVDHPKPRCAVTYWITLVKVKVTVNINVFVVCPDDTSTAEPFVTKLGMMLHHHKLECCAKQMGSHLQEQGHMDHMTV